MRVPFAADRAFVGLDDPRTQTIPVERMPARRFDHGFTIFFQGIHADRATFLLLLLVLLPPQLYVALGLRKPFKMI